MSAAISGPSQIMDRSSTPSRVSPPRRLLSERLDSLSGKLDQADTISLRVIYKRSLGDGARRRRRDGDGAQSHGRIDQRGAGLAGVNLGEECLWPTTAHNCKRSLKSDTSKGPTLGQRPSSVGISYFRQCPDIPRSSTRGRKRA